MELFEEIERNYLSVQEAAEAAGVNSPQIHSWAKYFRYFEMEYLKGKPLIKRESFDKFKVEHPELIKRQSAKAA